MEWGSFLYKYDNGEEEEEKYADGDDNVSGREDSSSTDMGFAGV